MTFSVANSPVLETGQRQNGGKLGIDTTRAEHTHIYLPFPSLQTHPIPHSAAIIQQSIPINLSLKIYPNPQHLGSSRQLNISPTLFPLTLNPLQFIHLASLLPMLLHLLALRVGRRWVGRGSGCISVNFKYIQNKEMSSGVSIEGERETGKDVRSANVRAAMSVANIVRSSLGPQGLDKMIVDEIGEVTITNDGATILKKLEVEHPVANLLVQLAQLQDSEVGDGTTSVVILAAELLKRANELIKMKVHPTNIITGYKMAAREACTYIQDKLAVSVDSLGEKALLNCAQTSMSSKLINADPTFFGNLVVSAINAIKQETLLGPRYNVRSINILKAHGQSSTESQLIKGYAIQTVKAHQQMPTLVKKAKIACLDFNLNKFRLQLGIQVLVDDPKNLEKIRQKECDILKSRVTKILEAGANVILTKMGIDDLASKYMVEAGCIGLRRVDKGDLQRIAKLTGATVVSTMATPEGEEVFDPSFLGECDEVVEEAVGDNDFVFFKGCKKSSACTIVLRGPNEYMLDEVERSLHDSLCVAKRTLESGIVVAGGGAVDIALSIHLDQYCREVKTKEQIAISEFSEALNIIPKTLAVNAAKDATELVSKLRAYHAASQVVGETDPARLKLKYTGLDLLNGKARNNLDAGVLEPMISKINSLRFATEAAITILRIDDMIKLAPEQREEAPAH